MLVLLSPEAGDLMTGALAWLNDLAQWVGRWFPRLIIVHPTHCGVRFGRGGSALAVGAGLIFYWPLIHDLIQVPITTISYQTCAQTLPAGQTAGSIFPRNAVVACAVQFRIVDPIKASINALNFHAIVDNRVRAAIMANWAAEGSDNSSWCADAKRMAAFVLQDYGIEIEHLDATDIGLGCALKNISDWSYSDGTDGKRPTS